MNYQEPGSLEIFITLAVGNIFGSIYKEYVDQLDLMGNERVLDFGSGAGTPALYLAQRLARGGGHLTCLDISRVWMQVAQKRLKKYGNVDFCLGDIRTQSFPSASFDRLFIHFVLHDMSAQERPGTVKELARTHAIQGQVYVREPLRFILTYCLRFHRV